MRPSPTNHLPDAGSSPCCHKRLIDRICAEDGQATSKYRCLECGAILDEAEVVVASELSDQP
jgi:hypothetical protein